MFMLSKSFRESAHLFYSLDALHHGRALLLSGVTWLVAWVLWVCAGFLLAQQGWAPPMLLSALSVIVLIWGSNAAGIMTMDELGLRPPRPWSVLWRHALSASQQMVMVLLTLILLSLLGLLALTLLLLVCRLPVLGPWLYAVVFPLATMVAALVLFVFPVFILALSAPAIWSGLDASTSLAQIWSVTRRRLPTAAAWLLVLTLITATSSLLLLGVLVLGLWLVNAMSASLLSAPGASLTDLFLIDEAVGNPVSNYANAASVGVVAIPAVVCTVAGLILLRGVCLVYRHVLTGLDTHPEQQLVRAALGGAQKNLRELQTHAPLKPAVVGAGLAATFNSQQSSHVGVGTTGRQDAVRSDAWSAQSSQHPRERTDIDIHVREHNADEGTHSCPACGSITQLTDFYCGDCGQSLR
jgi:hypothetical protein